MRNHSWFDGACDAHTDSSVTSSRLSTTSRLLDTHPSPWLFERAKKARGRTWPGYVFVLHVRSMKLSRIEKVPRRRWKMERRTSNALFDYQVAILAEATADILLNGKKILCGLHKWIITLHQHLRLSLYSNARSLEIRSTGGQGGERSSSTATADVVSKSRYRRVGPLPIRLLGYRSKLLVIELSRVDRCLWISGTTTPTTSILDHRGSPSTCGGVFGDGNKSRDGLRHP